MISQVDISKEKYLPTIMLSANEISIFWKIHQIDYNLFF